MTVPRVWAPHAKMVEIEHDGRRVAMSRSADGWWNAASPLPPGIDYSFFVDGDGPFPDPRSPFQPAGVHGPSRIVDHAAFRWSDQGWNAPPLADAIIYELHVGTFTPGGTFLSTIERLDALRALGVTHVELMPVAEFSGERGWGYDGVDLYAPHHAYGGPEALKTLVDACHARGLAVVLDVVYNHFGPSGNYWSQYATYLTKRYATPWGDAVNLDDRGSDEVRRFFCDNALMWLRDYHFDGLRLDAVHAIFDRSATHFLEQLANEVAELEQRSGRRFVLIAESDLNDPRLLHSRERGGYALQAQWSDDFHHALHTVLTEERAGYYRDFGTLTDLAKAVREAFVYDGSRYSVYRERHFGRAATSLGGGRFVCCTQNHDQVGNRARGERLAHLVSLGRAKIAASLLILSPFVPMLFQGEEWAASTPFQYFTGHDEPELGHAVTEGRKREFAAFGWKADEVPDPQEISTFERSKLDWGERDREPHRGMLDWYRRLIALRSAVPALCDGRMDQVQTSFDHAKRWFVMRRDAITMACNLSSIPQSVPLGGVGAKNSNDGVIMASAAGCEMRGGMVELPIDAVAILAPATFAGR